jgi:hypothetical protein
MATETLPIQQLAATVNQLYALSGDPNISQADQQALLLQAHDLRGDLVTLASLQITAASAGYNDLMASLAAVTTALKAAAANIAKVTDVVNGAAQVATAIDNLLKQAAQIAAVV